MARLARLVVPGEAHIVLQRARLGGTVFHDGADRRAFLTAVAAAAREHGVAWHGYGLDAGEARLLVTPPDAGSLGRFVQAAGRRHVRAHNDRHGSTGTPWEGRFRSCPLETARVLECLRWVELPGGLEPELVPARDETSAGHHLGLWVDPALADPAGFWSLGNTPFEREAAYRAFVEPGTDDAEAVAIRRCALHGWVLGSDAFARRVEALATRPSRPRPRGRKAASRRATALGV